MENKDYVPGRQSGYNSGGIGVKTTPTATAGPPPPLYADQLQPTQFPSYITQLFGGGGTPSAAPGGMAPPSNFQMPDFSKLFSGLGSGISGLLSGQGSLPGMGGQQTQPMGGNGGMGLMSLIQGLRGGQGGFGGPSSGVTSTGPAGATTPGQNTNQWGKGWGWGR